MYAERPQTAVRTIETLLRIFLLSLPSEGLEQALAHWGVKMSDYHAAVPDSLRKQLAAVNCITPIVDCIRKMRVEGLADNEIAGLFRYAADELDEATMTEDGEVDPAA
jgi:hypothetical protein